MAQHIIDTTSFYSLTPYAMRESILSIASSDYSVGFVSLDFLKIALHQGQPVVLNSSFFSLPNFEEILDLALTHRTSLRVQVSMGAELEKYREMILSFLECDGALDLLVDRPLPSEKTAQIQWLVGKQNVRICVVVNKYFQLADILESIPQFFASKVKLLFLPPTSENSCYFSADEIVKILEVIQWKNEPLQVLVFANCVRGQKTLKNKDFFLSLDFEKYYSESNHLQDLRGLRKSLDWMVKRKMIFFIDFIYSALVFLRNPSTKNFVGLFQIVKARVIGIFHWSYIILYHRVWSRVWTWIRYSGYVTVHNFIKYRLPHHLKTTLLFYPFRKIFWFFNYQYKNRVLPLLNGRE